MSRATALRFAACVGFVSSSAWEVSTVKDTSEFHAVVVRLEQITQDLAILRANDTARDQHILLQRERISELLRSNNSLLTRAREAEAKLKRLEVDTSWAKEAQGK